MTQRTILWRLARLAMICLLPFLLLIGIAIPSASSHSNVSHKSLEAFVQGTPTPDVTATALAGEKLRLEVKQLQQQEDRSLQAWIWNYTATIFSPSVVLLVALLGGLRWWFRDRRLEREKRSEERFQSIVVNLGSKDIEARIGATIMLRTFLQSKYKQFHYQVFDLAVANLRLQMAGLKDKQPNQPDEPGSLDSLSQALITLFKESFPQARDWTKKHSTRSGIIALFDRLKLLFTKQFDSQSLDASELQLNNAYLADADLREVWMPKCSLCGANLSRANFVDANLAGVNVTKANLAGADLTGANLADAILIGATLTSVKLIGADLTGANLTDAELPEVDLTQVKRTESEMKIDFTRANLKGAKLMRLNLAGATLTHVFLAEADLANAVLAMANLEDATFAGATLTNVQFAGADLINADFGGADLTSADLTSADLTGINFTVAQSIKSVKFKGATLVKAQLMHQNLAGVDLTGANLTDADLTGANLTDANLTNVTFTRANLTDADLSRARLKGAHPETAHLQNTKMQGVLDLTPGLETACQGAIF